MIAVLSLPFFFCQVCLFTLGMGFNNETHPVLILFMFCMLHLWRLAGERWRSGDKQMQHYRKVHFLHHQ